MFNNLKYSDISILIKKYGTPLVLYSEEILKQNTKSLINALPKETALAYSIKANPNPSLLSRIQTLGLMAEAASEGELSMALKTGISPEKLLLGGPIKTPESVALAVNNGVCAILIESLNDLKLVSSIAHNAGRQIKVLLRVNPACLGSNSVLRMAGVPSQFGIDEEQLPNVINSCKKESARYAGLFLYAGSQHFNANDIVSNTEYLCLLADKLIRNGFPVPEILDFGGGFGVPEDKNQYELDLEKLRIGLNVIFNKYVNPLTRLGLQKTVFESGRYIVSRSGIYIARIMDLKRSRGKLFAVLDGGINNMGIRQLLFRTFEPKIIVLSQRKGAKREKVTIVGPTCTPIDIIHKGCELQELHIGDLIAIKDFGAYTTSYSAIHFCGHPWPAEILVEGDGTSHLLRRRGLREESCGVGYVAFSEKRETTK